MSNKAYTTLVNEGPQPARDLPGYDGGLPVELREDGLQKFNPRANYAGSVKQGGGKKIAVYYLRNKHTPQGVIKKWLSVNDGIREAIGDTALHWRICEYGDEWKAASRELLDLDMSNRGGGDTSDVTRECPFCGDDVRYAQHLPKCEAKP